MFRYIIGILACTAVISITAVQDYEAKVAHKMIFVDDDVQISATSADHQIITIKEPPERTKIRCTCYVPTGNPTKSGVMPYEGILASNNDHLGWTAKLYSMDGEYIGEFLSADTGGHYTLKNGTSVDVYRDNLERAHDWIHTYGDYVMIEWVEPQL